MRTPIPRIGSSALRDSRSNRIPSRSSCSSATGRSQFQACSRPSTREETPTPPGHCTARSAGRCTAWSSPRSGSPASRTGNPLLRRGKGFMRSGNPTDKSRLIVARQSKYEWELAKGTTHQELCQRFSSAPEKLEAILQSHESQVRVREELASLTSAEMRMLGEIHEPLAHDLVISL